MRAFLAIVLFELRRRWLVVPVGLAAGLVGFVGPALARGGGGGSTMVADARHVLSMALPALFTAALAVGLAPGLLASDLRARRLSFFLVRPLAGIVLLAARIVSACFVFLAGALSARLPFYVAGVASPFPWDGPAPSIVALIAFPLALLPLALLLFGVVAAVSLSASARTPWLVLEAATVAGVVLWFSRLVAQADRVPLPELALLLLMVGAVAGAFPALAAAIVRGGIDLTRAHRAQAVTLAVVLAVAGAAAIMSVRWYQSVQAGDLRVVKGEEPAPGWLLVDASVHRRDYRAMILADAESGGWVRLGIYRNVPTRPPGARPGPDRSVFAWIQELSGGMELVRFHREQGRIARRGTGLRVDLAPLDWAVSADGKRVALLHTASGDGLRLDLVESGGGPIARLGLKGLVVHQLLVLPDRVRLLLYREAGWCLAEWGFPSERGGDPTRLTCLGDGAPEVNSRTLLYQSPFGPRVLVPGVRNSDGEEVGMLLFDGDSLEPLAELVPPALGREGWVEAWTDLLPGGAVLGLWRQRDDSDVEAMGLFDPDGRSLGFMVWPGRLITKVLARRGESELLVAIARHGAHRLEDWPALEALLRAERSAAVWVEMQTGRVAPMEELSGSSRARHRVVFVGAPLFEDEWRRPVIFDVSSGELRPLL